MVFLGILAAIGTGLLFLMALVFIVMGATAGATAAGGALESLGGGILGGLAMGAACLVIAILYLVPTLFLLR